MSEIILGETIVIANRFDLPADVIGFAGGGGPGPIIKRNGSNFEFRDNTDAANVGITAASITFPNGSVQSAGLATQSGDAAYYMPSNNYAPGGIATIAPGANNQVQVFAFYLPAAITVIEIDFETTAGTAGALCAAGIYSGAGAKLVAADNQDGSVTSIKTVAVSAITLPPAMYYAAWGASSTLVNVRSIAAVATYSGILNSNTKPKIGTAANALAAGVLPATLGVITGSTTIGPIVMRLQG